jgi:O-antigen ligase
MVYHNIRGLQLNQAPTQPRRPGALEKVGFGSLSFFVFSICSSAVDLTPGLRSIRPSLIAAFVCLSILFVSGKAAALLRNKIIVIFIALTLWLVVSVPFSVWPRGAVSTIIGSWQVPFLVLFIAGGLIWTSSQCRKIGNLIGYSAITLSLIALALNQREDGEGRLMLQGSRYGNPNDLALMVLMALPFLCFMIMRRGNGIRRLIGLAGIPPILVTIAETGSRGAMIGAAMAFLAVFLSVGWARKIKLLIAASIALAVILTVAPARTTTRFLTFLGDGERVTSATDQVSAIESARARRMLLMDSITVTLQNPLFGVGAGNFQVAQDKLAKARGETLGNWHLTHNTYTQISSESGLPGLFLFLMALFFCFRSISRVLRIPVPSGSTEWQDINGIAFALRVCLAAFLSVAFFDSLAYSPVLTMLLGLSISVEYCAENLAAVSAPIPSLPAPQWVDPSRRRSPAPSYPGRQFSHRM